MILLRIPLEPKTKKNHSRIIQNKRTGKIMLIPAKQYIEYEKECMEYIGDELKLKIDTPVNVECHFYMQTRRKCDLTNLLEAIDDILVKAGVLADDNYTIIAGHDGSRVHYDKEEPRTVVYIEEMGE